MTEKPPTLRERIIKLEQENRRLERLNLFLKQEVKELQAKLRSKK